MRHFTRKTGGNIHKRSVFENIISIGYEFETSSLSKLTMITNYNEELNADEKLLLNTDTARKDLDKFNSVQDDKEEDEEENPDYVIRQEELIDVDAYENGKVNPNISFLITNDIANTRFVKQLNHLCEDYNANKDNLYYFRTNNNETYKINFIFWEEEPPCGVFSNTEWILTYYKPKQSSNVIMETFTNAISNLLLHVNQLTKIKGNLLFHSENEDLLIEKPKERVLFHLPNTNLYYLQSDYLSNKPEFEIDDICIVPQMTFSAHISNVYMIMKQMANDSLKTIDTNAKKFENLLEVLNKVDYCVKELVNKYNTNSSTKHKLISNSAKQNILIKSIQNYLRLILYKLFNYYNSYLQNPNIKYFKDTLSFNCRHSNYTLYVALKECMIELLSDSMENANENLNDIAIQIIREIIIQPSVLNSHLLNNVKNVRKNAFNIQNVLDKENQNYGNPSYSLISYLQFFEDPVINDYNLDIEDNILHYDWLEYKSIDTFSSKMQLKNNIVMLEVRSFPSMVSTYMYSIPDDTVKHNMTNGVCNQILKKYTPDIRGFSMLLFKKLLEFTNKRGNSKSKKSHSKSKKSHSKSK